MQYHVPTIDLVKSTPKEAVCQVFEKVNTGGVTLTVFELLTATYAVDDFELRKDWDERHERLAQHKLLAKVDATTFLQIVTLLATHNRRHSHLQAHPEDDRVPAVSCKRRDMLRLPLDDYRQWADFAERGLRRAVPFLHNHRIFRYRDLPYATQLVPLGAIFGWMEDQAESYASQQRLGQWFWCGVLGEMYGGATETRFANDLEDCIAWMENQADSIPPRTVQAAQFQAERLLTLRTRNSAAYKGLYALQMKQGGRDFKSGQPIDVHAYMEDAIDIHHVFPRAWCASHNVTSGIADCIVNKTALDAHTNRRIGGNAPSVYLSRIEMEDGIESHVLDGFLRSHDIDPMALRRDDFAQFFNQRFENLLRNAERAMGKPVNRRPGRDESPFAEHDMDTEDPFAHDPQHRRRFFVNMDGSFVADPDEILQGSVVQDSRIQLVARRVGDGKNNRRPAVDPAVSLVEEPGRRIRLEKGLQGAPKLSHAADFPNVPFGRLPVHGEGHIGFGPVEELDFGDNVMALSPGLASLTLVVRAFGDLGADKIGQVSGEAQGPLPGAFQDLF